MWLRLDFFRPFPEKYASWINSAIFRVRLSRRGGHKIALANAEINGKVCITLFWKSQLTGKFSARSINLTLWTRILRSLRTSTILLTLDQPVRSFILGLYKSGTDKKQSPKFDCASDSSPETKRRLKYSTDFSDRFHHVTYTEQPVNNCLNNQINICEK